MNLSHRCFQRSSVSQAISSSADIKDKSAVEAVKSVTAGLPLTVNVDGKFIRVSAGKNVSNEQAAKKETSPSAVTGLVTDSEGEPLPGVTIRQKNGKILTVTDNDGNFKIRTDQDKLHDDLQLRRSRRGGRDRL